ncbi:ATP-binding protein (plasmid) [Deinococcus radiomollis]|uniref:PAS domain-containing sensor histidine kinase n=1 Tax=Deinococcus radiomollis TaxID=468916 RepID=UPI0038929352
MPERPASTGDLDLNELQSIVDGSSDCIKVLDLDGHLLSMNAGGMETMEIEDFGSCQYIMWPEFWKGEAKTQVQQALEAARAGQTVNFEGPANTFLGTPRWWEVRVSPIRNQGGEVTRLLAISRDVTARRTAEERLLENERGLQKRATELELQVDQQALALNAFVRFTTAVASSTELEVIAAAAAEILRDVVEGAISGFFLVRGDTAYPLVFSANTPAAVIEARRRGVPLTTPLAVQAFKQRSVAFAEGDTSKQQSVGYATALSITPYFVQDRPYAMLATGTERAVWSAQERAVVESVGRGLGLALERTEQARVLTEQRDVLDHRTRELEATNAELEAFTHSASHDLRTPVRHVMGFAELAEKSLTNGQYDKTAQYLGVVKQGALRMTALIDGMLLLSRSGRQKLQVRSVDLNALVTQAQRDAGAEFTGHPVRWQIGVLPPVQGDPGLLQQVMTNLLSNAVKYSSTRELSVVQVWAQVRETETEVFVKDNGVGFDPRYVDKLFGLFQRLHTEKEFTGTGVGLATVRRVVLKHGGQVAARSLDDEGAVFSFTLPRGSTTVAQFTGSSKTNTGSRSQEAVQDH